MKKVRGSIWRVRYPLLGVSGLVVLLAIAMTGHPAAWVLGAGYAGWFSAVTVHYWRIAWQGLDPRTIVSEDKESEGETR